MADVSITYKGNTIAEMNESGEKILKTSGKYCEGDINISYEKSSSEREIDPTWTDWRYFSYYDNRNSLLSKLKYSDTSNGTNFSNMFYQCNNLTTVPLFDTGSGTNFSYMFNTCRSLITVPLFDTSNGTNFSNMFYQCTKLTEVPLFDTSNGTNFNGMFKFCYELPTVPKFDTSSGTDFSYMFYYCYALPTIPQFDTSSVTNFSNMFNSCESLITVPQFDTSKGTNFNNMFQYCESLITVPQFDTSNGTYFDRIFYSCGKLTTVSKLNLTKAFGSITDIFLGCKALENLTIEGEIKKTGLNVSNSTKLTHDSLMSIINALHDYSGTTGTYKVTLGATNLAKLTTEEIAIAEGKGWTLA